MFFTEISIKKPVMILMLMLALLLFGVIAYLNIPLNYFPEGDMGFVSVTTVFPGAPPEQIDSLVTRKIEDEVSSIQGVDNIRSYNMSSVSVMVIQFELGKDGNIANQEVKDKIDAILNEFPEGAETPIVSKLDITAAPVIELVVSGDIELTELSYIVDETIKDRLSRIAGVGSVDIQGSANREYRVGFTNKAIFENSVSLLQISNLIATANMDFPGGNFQNENQDYSVSLKGELTGSEDLESMMIPTAVGMRRLDQLADIEELSEDVRERITYYNSKSDDLGKNALLLQVIKASGGNAVEISKAVKDILPEIKRYVPEGVEINLVTDESLITIDSVNDTLFNIVLGVILTALVLLFFLHDIRSTLIVAISMPLSIIPTFLFMNSMGITLNMLSLMGLSTSVGVLVMNSVVVLENIFKYRSGGMDRESAASKGTSEVAVAVFASTLTNVCVFVPIGTMDGMVGVYLGDFAITVVIATILSLLISLTVTPMLASRFLPKTEKKKGNISQGIEDFFKRMEKSYEFYLEKVLHNRFRSVVMILGTLVVFVIAMVNFTKIPFEFIPLEDNNKLSLKVEFPQDGSMDQTIESLTVIEDLIKEYPEVESIITTIGSLSSMEQGTNLAKIDLKLIDKSQRDLSSELLASYIGESLTVVPNAEISVAVPGMVDGISGVNFYITGESIDSLLSASSLLQNRLKELEGITGLKTNVKEGKPEIKLYPKRETMADMGVTVYDISLSLRAAVDGVVMSQIRKDGREYDIRVTMDDYEISSYENIRNIPIATKNGIYPISFFADIKMEEGINKLYRNDKVLAVEFTGNLVPGVVLSEVSTEIESLFKELDLDGIKLKWSGSAEMMDETTRNMAIAFVTAIVLTYMLLAAVLGSLGQPLLILSTVPLSLIGIVAIFLITGLSMNMLSMLAIVMLVGMVVNNAILILEYSNQLRSEGMGVRDSLIKAAPAKLQPILMSNIATILGMLPMAMGIGSSGAVMRQPMGLVSIAGLATATILTLFFIPALENSIESGKDRMKKGVEKLSSRGEGNE